MPSCQATVLIRSFGIVATVVGKCACGKRTGELAYALPSQREPTIEAARLILKLLHQELPANERILAPPFKD